MNALSLSWSKADFLACPRAPQCSQHNQTRSYDAFVLETNPLLSSSQIIENEANLSHDIGKVNIEQNSPSLHSSGEIRTIVICNT